MVIRYDVVGEWRDVFWEDDIQDIFSGYIY
jgi:hypothetical protein